MTVSVAGDVTRSSESSWNGRSGDPGAARPTGAAAASGPVRRRSVGIRAGQVVAAQTAVALLLAAAGRGPLVLAAAGLGAAVLVLTAWLRLRRRWLFEWIGVGLRYWFRRHTLAPNAEPAALLDLLVPGARVLPVELGGDAAAVISDGYGLTAVLELGDPIGLLADAPQALPTPASLLPAASAETPPIRIQLRPHRCPGADPARRWRHARDVVPAAHRRAAARPRAGPAGGPGAAHRGLVGGGPAPRALQHRPQGAAAARPGAGAPAG